MQAEEKSLRVLLWLVAIGFFMQTLDATIVNTTLPAMARGFGESPLRMQSVVVAYSLTMAMLIPASGWIADRFGTRRVFVGAISLFVIGSIACALSGNLMQLVAARVVQGMVAILLVASEIFSSATAWVLRWMDRPSLTRVSKTLPPSSCALENAPRPASQICCADSLTAPDSWGPDFLSALIFCSFLTMMDSRQ